MRVKARWLREKKSRKERNGKKGKQINENKEMRKSGAVTAQTNKVRKKGERRLRQGHLLNEERPKEGI